MEDESEEALRGLREEVRAFVRRWRDRHGLEPMCDAWLRGYDLEFSRAMAVNGWIGITWPKDLGGGGRSNLARMVVTEELLRAGAPVAAHWIADRQIGPSILRYGSRELQEEFLPRIAAGEVTFCLGMSETESGSDLASVKTSAVRVDRGWVLSGRKIWTSQAHRSTHAYVLARTERTERRHVGLSEFVVDMASPGVEVRPIIDLTGEHHFNEVLFDDVLVPARRLLGLENEGWSQVTEQLSFERGGMERLLSTYPLFAVTIDEVATRGVTDAEAETLGEAIARLRTLRGVAWHVAASMDEGEAPVLQAAILKDLGTSFETDVNELARRLLPVEPDPSASGAPGLMAEGVLAAPGFTIRGGTTEVLRTIIARGVVSDGLAPRRGTGGHLRAVADDVLDGRGGDPDDGGLPSVWAVVGDLGWTAVGIEEDRGGVGGGLSDAAELIEATGRHSVPIPLAETMLVAHLLRGTEHLSDDATTATLVLPAGSDDVRLPSSRSRPCLTGTVSRVPWACSADRFLVYALDDDGRLAAAMVAAAAPGMRIERGRNLAGEPRDTITFESTPVLDIVETHGSQDDALVLAGFFRAVAIVGALERAFELTRGHVTVREQFGRPLSRFQAVGHGLAVMASEVEAARQAVDAARASLDGEANALSLVGAARVTTATAASRVASLAHQLHGAMGVTREHPLHLTTRRLWSWRDEWGTQRSWARRLGHQLVPLGSEAVWEWVTGDDRLPH